MWICPITYMTWNKKFSMNSVRQNTTLSNGSLLKFNMKTKNPVGTLDVHYPRFASVLSCSLSRLKKRSFPLAPNSPNSVVHWIAYPDRILRFLYLPYESANSHHCILYHINLIRDELYRILFPFIHCVNRTKLKLFQRKWSYCNYNKKRNSRETCD